MREIIEPMLDIISYRHGVLTSVGESTIVQYSADAGRSGIYTFRKADLLAIIARMDRISKPRPPLTRLTFPEVHCGGTTYIIPEAKEAHDSFMPRDVLFSGCSDLPLGVTYASGNDFDDVLLSSVDGKLECVATDKHRYAIHRARNARMSGSGSFAIPAQTVEVLKKIRAESWTFACGEEGGVFLAGNWQVISKPGVFPKGWRRTVGAERTVSCSRQELLAALYRSAGDAIECRKKTFTTAFSSASTLRSETSLVMQGEILGRFAIDRQYLIDAVEHTRSDPVILGYTGPEDPIFINDDNVVMPMRI